MRIVIVRAFLFLGLGCQAFGAEAEYKIIRIETMTNAKRVRLPLTDVTGKVRIKEMTADGFGRHIAPSKTTLGNKNYLKWQIGYDTPDTKSPSVMPQIRFQRQGATKYGHGLSKIVFAVVRLGVLSTNDLLREIAALRQIPAAESEENQPAQMETDNNASASGIQRAEQHLPQFTKTTPQGAVQIQLKQKQRAVGLASRQHNEDIRTILGRVLEATP